MTESSSILYDSTQVATWLDSMMSQLTELIGGDDSTALIGIRRGGVDVCRYLHTRLTQAGVPINDSQGELNIAFYRDDFSSVGLHPVVGPSQVPFSIDNRHIILIDDVLGTGRTVRAAMNEIFDYGRPSRITLAVLVQREGHELPIRADVSGQNLKVDKEQYIVLDASRMQVTVGRKP